MDGPMAEANGDAALAYYKAAREELVLRLGLRDRAVGLYATVTGALLGYFLQFSPDIAFLGVIPFVGLAAATVIAQHHRAIGDISEYCVMETMKTRPETGVGSASFDSWLFQADPHAKAKGTSRGATLVNMASAAHGVLIVAPSALSVIALLFSEPLSTTHRAIASIGAIVFTAVSTFVFLSAWWTRCRSHERMTEWHLSQEQARSQKEAESAEV